MPPFAIPLAMKALPWKWIGIGAGALAVVAFVWIKVDAYGDHRYEAGKARVQAEWDKDARKREVAYMALQADYRAKEQRLAQTVGAITQEKENAQARTADAQRRLADSLRKRPERPHGLPDAGTATANGEDPPKCTGAQLYRNDLEFLRGEAGEADGLRHALKACYAQYEAARSTSNR